jgi:hypothetical protein
MAVVTPEQLLKMLGQFQEELGELVWKMQDTSSRIKALTLHSEAMALDTESIRRIVARHETRLDRIERRLEIAEASA